MMGEVPPRQHGSKPRQLAEKIGGENILFE
jgi:hypothetical protein